MMESMMELIESRTLLAGNVTAAVIGGNLLVVGDSGNSQIEIQGDFGDARSFSLIGNGDTTINGTSDPAFFSNVPSSIVIRMGAGDDLVTIGGVNILKDLQVELGEGSDSFLMGTTTIHRRLAVSGGGGADQIFITRANVFRGTNILAGGGNDLIALTGGSFGGEVLVRGESGNDLFSTFQARFVGEPRFVGGAGSDRRNPGETISFDFNTGTNGWNAGFSDFQINQKADYDLESGLRALPESVARNRRGFFLSGENHSDDLLMYLTRRLGASDGIRAGQRYLVAFDVRFASNATGGSIGIGGSPGDSVYLKVGASNTPPANHSDEDGFARLNLDHGQQASSGADISQAGTIANGLTPDDISDPDNPPYRLVRRLHLHPVTVLAGSNGRLQLVVGTDSGFEGTTAIYYQQISVRLIPVPA